MIIYGLLAVLTIMVIGLLSAISPSMDTMLAWFPNFTTAVGTLASAFVSVIPPFIRSNAVLVAGIGLFFEAGVVTYAIAVKLLKWLRIIG